VTKKGKVLVGFRERLAPFIADVQHCDVLAEPVGSLVKPLADLLMSLSLRERVPQIEVAVADNAVALVFRVLETPTADDLSRLRDFAHASQVRIYLQPGGLEGTFTRWTTFFDAARAFNQASTSGATNTAVGPASVTVRLTS